MMQNMSEEMLGLTVVLILLAVGILCTGILIATYILQSLGLYQIADRRKIANPWLAWLPYGNLWIFGSIVDHHARLKGKDSKWRFLLLVLDAVAMIFLVFAYVLIFVMALVLGFQAVDGAEPDIATVLTFFCWIMILYIFMYLALIALSSCQTVCFYKIYEELAPGKTLKYFLLTLLVPLAGGICLLKCAKSPIGVPLDPIPPFETPQAAE